jgi:hypothetical protein
MSRAIPLLPLWALCGLLYGNLYLYLYQTSAQYGNARDISMYEEVPTNKQYFLHGIRKNKEIFEKKHLYALRVVCDAQLYEVNCHWLERDIEHYEHKW